MSTSTRTPQFTPSWSQSLMRGVYSVAMLLVIPFMLLKLFRRNTDTTQSVWVQLAQRFGAVPRPAQSGGYLFHCVSVGEVVAASCVIKALQQQSPDTPVMVTTTTTTGAERVRAIFGNSVQHSYLPADLPFTMGRMLARVKPQAVIITEVELWPNLLHRCCQQHIPVILINARMTDRSARRYQKVPALFAPMMQQLTQVCAQGQRDYDNYLLLGMPAERLLLTHNIKFDQAVDSSTTEPLLTLMSSRRVVVAGSTHEPEEQVLLDTVAAHRKRFPELLLVLVPRHPDRFEAVATMLNEQNVRFVRSSVTRQIEHDCQVVLVDEMGLLTAAYQQAHITFVGGSLADRGGHNALEPAAASKPVIMGPHIYNNPVICAYLQEQGALKLVTGTPELITVLDKWLSKPTAAEAAGQAGYQVLQNNKGALAKTLACITSL
ncbi:lipid IV(A) 3-deoxy-D-manno-octulosonic acid transferase [Salinimonas marina]|uniref:lipid IV(A) 3-deoxy-D-manno-octulosonic acid transferase n=1 Tax=Salinimonas marina TaxID=2785918 RepID=UPI001E3A9E2E|nr:lipid IV(A) 3-deoxy-D-manno-octulosonic acid transferase [Salinimonas marina]